MAIDSFVQHNATACAYLASLSDTLDGPTPITTPRPSLAPQGSTSLTLDQLLNGCGTKAKVPAVYKTCLSECILGTTDFDAVLIGLSDLYEQVGWQMATPPVAHVNVVQVVYMHVRDSMLAIFLRQHACKPLHRVAVMSLHRFTELSARQPCKRVVCCCA